MYKVKSHVHCKQCWYVRHDYISSQQQTENTNSSWNIEYDTII